MRKDISSGRDAPSLVVRSSTEAVARVRCPLGVSGVRAMEVIRNEVNVMGFGVLQRNGLVNMRGKMPNKFLQVIIPGTGGSGYPSKLEALYVLLKGVDR